MATSSFVSGFSVPKMGGGIGDGMGSALLDGLVGLRGLGTGLGVVLGPDSMAVWEGATTAGNSKAVKLGGILGGEVSGSGGGGGEG